MAGRVSFGYEQPDGSVKYGLTYSGYSFEEIQDYIQLRTVLYDVNLKLTAGSVEDYFLEYRSDEENTTWRILYQINGNTVCQTSKMNGFLVFYPNKHSS